MKKPKKLSDLCEKKYLFVHPTGKSPLSYLLKYEPETKAQFLGLKFYYEKQGRTHNLYESFTAIEFDGTVKDLKSKQRELRKHNKSTITEFNKAIKKGGE